MNEANELVRDLLHVMRPEDAPGGDSLPGPALGLRALATVCRTLADQLANDHRRQLGLEPLDVEWDDIDELRDNLHASLRELQEWTAKRIDGEVDEDTADSLIVSVSPDGGASWLPVYDGEPAWVRVLDVGQQGEPRWKTVYEPRRLTTREDFLAAADERSDADA